MKFNSGSGSGSRPESFRDAAYCCCLLLLFSYHIASAQNDTASHPSKFTLHGYIKYLEEFNSRGDASPLLTNGLLHNRLNFRYDASQQINLRLEIRNRIYYGELLRDYPVYADYLTAYNGTFDLSKNWVNKNGVLMNSTIDRASAEYNNSKWDITIGRQRINWGINTVWTPNDIFNTFNYFDFDYEERPGSDAARVQYAFNSSSSLELAASPGRTSKQNVDPVGSASYGVEALMYRLNKWNYDFQLFSGAYEHDFTAGIGWAGNIKDAGFKGEITYFTPYNYFADTNSLAVSLSFDYGFKNGIYLLISGLYNSAANNSIINVAQLATEALSAKNIFPFKYTAFAEISYPFTPIFKATLGAIYSPTTDAFILLPTFTYSLADNWVLDLIGQSFFAENNNKYSSLGSAAYLRIKWGF